MVKKKLQLGLCLFFVLSIFLASVVAAQSPGALRYYTGQYVPPTEGTPRDTVNDFFIQLQQNDIVRFIVGNFSTGAAGESEVFFIKVLVFLLLVLLVGYAARRIPGIGDRSSLVVLISILVSLIAIRYITDPAIVNFIWLPYGVVGIFLASVLPFILGFFFIESFPSRIFRKVLWSLYVVIFVGLAWFRWESLRFDGWNGGWIYLATGILSLLLIVFDSQIRNWKASSELKDIKDASKRAAARKIQIKINDLYDDYHKLGDREILAQIRRLEAQLSNVLQGR